MRRHAVRSASLAALGLIGFGIVFPAWGQQCIDPMPSYPNPSDPLDSAKFITPDPSDPASNQGFVIPAPTVTDFDGNLVCENIGGQFGGQIPDGVGMETFQFVDDEGNKFQFTVESYLDSFGIAQWRVLLPSEAPPPDDSWTVLYAIDTAITDAAQGGNGCLAAMGSDAVSGRLAWERSNGGYTLRNLYVCADTSFDPVGVAPPPPPEPVKGCFLENMDSTVIYGVTVKCEGVPAGEKRTIFVSKDTELDEFSQPHPVPGYGFLDENGVIDFNNVCICNGPTVPDAEPQCDPNPDQVNDPVTDALDPCTVQDADVQVEISIQNPRCVTVGGSRRCY